MFTLARGFGQTLRGEAQRSSSQRTSHATEAHSKNHQEHRRASTSHVTYKQIRLLWVLEAAFEGCPKSVILVICLGRVSKKALVQEELYMSLK